MSKQPDLDEIEDLLKENPLLVLMNNIQELKKIVAETDDDKIKLRAIGELNKASAILLRA